MTDPRPFQRLDDRLAGKPIEDDVLVPGVPAHLEEPLAQWITRLARNCPGWCTEKTDAWAGAPEEFFRAVALRLQVPHWLGYDSAIARSDVVGRDVAVDALLQMNNEFDHPPIHRHHLDDLATILHFGRSAYRVAEDGRSLELVIEETARQSVMNTIATAPVTVAEHLRDAWRHAYQPVPDPDAAYREAVRAVEAAYLPVVSPRNTQGTLGTVIRDLGNQTARWQLALATKTDDPGSIDHLVGLLDQLWQGQRSRHGGGATSRSQTEIEARASVHLAALAVHWLGTGVLERTP